MVTPPPPSRKRSRSDASHQSQCQPQQQVGEAMANDRHVATTKASSIAAKTTPPDNEPTLTLLTPHTRRLLKLIQDGTTDHAKMAATLLQNLTQQRHEDDNVTSDEDLFRPVVLWEILGQLQAYLVSSEWNTRYNAALAMEGVAENLPSIDQERFLYDEKRELRRSSRKDNTGSIWLKLSDLTQGNALANILTKGRPLLAVAESKYDIDIQDEQELIALTQESNHMKSNEFCIKRLELQRRMLARRLGLSDTLIHFTDQDGTHFQNQLIQEAVDSTNDGLRKKTRKLDDKMRTTVDKGNNPFIKEENLSIQSLLVREIQNYRNEQKSIGSDEKSFQVLSHHNPQTLLASELSYRMFDSNWHVRHGSLMGILALLRAWKKQKQFDEARMTTKLSGIGSWPHDILVRTICILALDRFGDFSGMTSESFSGVMVAPVREMAGQVFAMIFYMTPQSLQQEAVDILSSLSTYSEWEARHGALLAIKFCVALIDTTFAININWKKSLVSCFMHISIKALNDTSDDVQGVSAQILRLCYKNNMVDSSDVIISESALSLWDSLSEIRLVSSSIKDLINVLSHIFATNPKLVLAALSHNSSADKLDNFVLILARFRRMLDCEYITVKKSIIHVIGILSEEFTRIYSEIVRCENSSFGANRTAESFCALMMKVYAIFIKYNKSNDDEHDSDDRKALLDECFNTWNVLQRNSIKVLEGKEAMGIELEKSLLMDYFGFNDSAGIDNESLCKASSGQRIKVKVNHAAFIVIFCNFDEIHGMRNNCSNMLQMCLLAGLVSPFALHFEAACHLICALWRREEIEFVSWKKKRRHKKMEKVRAKLADILESKYIGCTAAAESDNLIEPRKVMFMLDSFSKGFDIASRGEVSGEVAATAIDEIWKGAVPSYMEKTTEMNKSSLTVDSMRLFAMLAGTVIAGGLHSLPQKLSPIVRPLMTSIQNEHDEQSQSLVCSFLLELISMLYEPVPVNSFDGLKKTVMKVLNNLCIFVVAREEPGSTAASLVIAQHVCKLRNETSLRQWEPIWSRLTPLFDVTSCTCTTKILDGLHLLKALSQLLRFEDSIRIPIFNDFVPLLVNIGCSVEDITVQKLCADVLTNMCYVDVYVVLKLSLPELINFLKDNKRDAERERAIFLLNHMLDAAKSDTSICKFVQVLLPTAMALMTDSNKSCAQIASSLFSRLVKVAPLVERNSVFLNDKLYKNEADLVIEHLIFGKKLPLCTVPPLITDAMRHSGIVLRKYQLEGVSWLRFLYRMNLNGVLSDEMGLGKTLQALVAIAMAHVDNNTVLHETTRSLIVCPSSIVGHWMDEIKRLFCEESIIFRAVALTGNIDQRRSIMEFSKNKKNLIVTSYAVLRSDIDIISRVDWTYCILDEGHLLKNPDTATSRASCRLRSRHRIILTGTPVQNNVNEVWATFNFLMPNFLGSSADFSKELAKPISKGQKPDAAAIDVAAGIEKLKALHQRVLPFILRREKVDVLQELPPKIITRIPCRMSSLQETLCRQFYASPQGRQSLLALQNAVSRTAVSNADERLPFDADALKSLLYLRLLCTHPWLVREKDGVDSKETYSVEMSGKLLALLELLQSAGIHISGLAAADNDSSILYCNQDDNAEDGDEYEGLFDHSNGPSNSIIDDKHYNNGQGSKCLIFAQFMCSLDIVEDLLLKRHMPYIKYLRLDGKIPQSQRSEFVDRFNRDKSIKIMLLTTRIGGLGLNLTGADTVIFLEHDWNPHVDLQAMDRAHRIGQTKTVNVYQLVTMDSVEEKTMLLHERKLAMTAAIVNTDNSSLYSMGTEKLLDIFQVQSNSSTIPPSEEDDFENNLDSLLERYKDEYGSLGVDGFVNGWCPKN